MSEDRTDLVTRLRIAHRHGAKTKAHAALFKEAADALDRQLTWQCNICGGQVDLSAAMSPPIKGMKL